MLVIYACSPMTEDANNAVDKEVGYHHPLMRRGGGERRRPCTVTFSRKPQLPFRPSLPLLWISYPYPFSNVRLGQKGVSTHHVAAGLECMTVTPPSTGTMSDTLVRDLALSIEPALYA